MGSYRQWEFGGHVALAIEVLSPSNTWTEMVRKRQFYDRHGADEYWAFDPDTGGLEAWVRDGTALRELLVGQDGFISPATGVVVNVLDGDLVVVKQQETAKNGEIVVARIEDEATVKRFFREKGTVAYGTGLFSPGVSFAQFASRFHGHDERIDVDSLGLCTNYWLGVAQDFLG